MSQRRSNSDTSITSDTEASPLEAAIELGEEVEFIIDGRRVECFLSDNVLVFDPKSPGARYAIRAYAYWLASEGDVAGARSLLNIVGRQG
jgi:hypothetical protein